MPKETKTILARLQSIAGELRITQGVISGDDARRLAEEIDACIQDLERGKSPWAVVEDEPPPTGTGG